MKKIIVADDNLTDRSILEATIQKLGYTAVCCNDGRQAWEAIRTADSPVLAVLDWMMPGLDGVEVCKKISENALAQPVYAIIITGLRAEKQDTAFALESGADDFILKPFDPNELRARIHVGFRMLALREQLISSNCRLLDYTKGIEALADERAQQLVRADRLSTIGLLSAGVAHEINNPTSFVAVNIQTIEENLPAVIDASADDASDEQKRRAHAFLSTMPEILNEMKNGVARIRNIVDGLKTYTHMSHDKQELFNIDACIESALQLCANRLKYHVTVRKDLAPTPPVYGDRCQVEQVFVNLFTNAADAIEETGKDGTLEISTSSENGEVIAFVHDSGPGILADSLEKVFMPFYTTKAIGKGTGLGLSISRNIVRDHKGELAVENHPDGGAVFKIALPSNHRGSE